MLTDLEHWNQSWQTLGGLIPDVSVYQRLMEHYREAHRYYHTLQHLQECFEHLSNLWRFDEGQTLSERLLPNTNRAVIEIALWFHDAIYNPHRTDNEFQSGQWAYQVSRAVGLRAEIAHQIQELILASKHDAMPQHLDAKILVDVDLAILGAAQKRFDEYEHQIRQEYSWVPEHEFYRARQRILDRFLARPCLYTTPYFQAALECQAKANLRRSLGR